MHCMYKKHWVWLNDDLYYFFIKPEDGFCIDWIIEEMSFPAHIQAGEPFTPWIVFSINRISAADTKWEFTARFQLHSVRLGFCHRKIKPGDTMQPCETPAYLSKWDDVVEGQKLVWTATLTIEDLIGPDPEPGEWEIAFVVLFEYSLSIYQDGTLLVTPFEDDYLFSSVTEQLPLWPILTVPEVYPLPIFNTELCYFPAYVTVDETFSPVFVINNASEAGTFYLAYWYLGEWHELYRGYIGAGELYTHQMGQIRITDLTGPITESCLADIRFHAGYIKEGVDPMETSTNMLACSVYVEVEGPPPPPPEEKAEIPWWPFVVGGTLVGGGATALLVRRRRR